MNINELKKWIGSSETSEDIITPSLEQRFRATLAAPPAIIFVSLMFTMGTGASGLILVDLPDQY